MRDEREGLVVRSAREVRVMIEPQRATVKVTGGRMANEIPAFSGLLSITLK